MPYGPLPLRASERSFLLSSLFGSEPDVERLRALAAQGLRWSVLERTARDLGQGAMVHDAILVTGIAAQVPPDVLASLRRRADRTAAVSALYSRAAAAAQRRLAETGIDSLALKGAALAHFTPGYHARRYVVDVDLLARPDEARRSWDHLISAGYDASGGIAGLDGRRFAETGIIGQPGHHLPPLVDPDGVTIDIHVALPGAPGALMDEAWLRRKEPAPPVLSTMDGPDLLGSLCAHVFHSHGGEPRYWVRHVADVHALTMAGVSIDEAERRFGAPVAASRRVVEETRRATIRPAVFHGRGVEGALGPWWWLGSRLTWSAKRRRASASELVAHVRRSGMAFLFPARRYMAERYGLDPRSPLLPLAYVWRPVGAAIRLLRGR